METSRDAKCEPLCLLSPCIYSKSAKSGSKRAESGPKRATSGINALRAAQSGKPRSQQRVLERPARTRAFSPPIYSRSRSPLILSPSPCSPPITSRSRSLRSQVLHLWCFRLCQLCGGQVLQHGLRYILLDVLQLRRRPVLHSRLVFLRIVRRWKVRRRWRLQRLPRGLLLHGRHAGLHGLPARQVPHLHRRHVRVRLLALPRWHVPPQLRLAELAQRAH